MPENHGWFLLPPSAALFLRGYTKRGTGLTNSQLHLEDPLVKQEVSGYIISPAARFSVSGKVFLERAATVPRLWSAHFLDWLSFFDAFKHRSGPFPSQPHIGEQQVALE